MHVIYAESLPKGYILKLREIFPQLKAIRIAASPNIYESISSHPDIFICAIDKGTLICSYSLDQKTLEQIENTGAKVIKSVSKPFGKYPDTCLLNAARIGDSIFHNTKLTDKSIKSEANNLSLNFIDVKQGYTRCSIIPVGNEAFITCDKGIAENGKISGFDVELIASGHVSLPGQNYGFIGGASGITPDENIFFLGDIRKHPNFNKISLFLERHHKRYVDMSDLPLLDAGGLIFLP